MKGETALLVLTMAMALGCSKPEPSPSPAKEQFVAGTPAARVVRDLGTFTLEIPKDWVVMDFTKKTFDQLVDELAKSNPGLTQLVAPMKATADSGFLKLVAFDTANASEGFTPNVNIIEMAVPNGVDFKRMVEENEKQLSASSGLFTRGSKRQLELGGAKFQHEVLGLKLNDASGKPKELAVSSFLGFKNGKQYVLTFTTLKSKSAGMMENGERIMKTFQTK